MQIYFAIKMCTDRRTASQLELTSQQLSWYWDSGELYSDLETKRNHY